ncbi:beta-ketoacyl-[acyl-carrier-protein] synthase family protein [Kerstersia gyiorum]|uniref:beta-ketoacyl-[acyl-carrier-protein] synthase family protein n=1 Tax=Kerstersia gyiorum TaxID=206506 RepID=UPI0020A20D76|nr:beta-ketoacyl-[acyl-carrier-protein] synthase family protein [Kerstersia gyiorum]MCP1638155.1 3-oxoacyl-[acyl-carrier-protein] synthase II [Kerstersia gyiorum]MCP1672745.1 3-oxoacyl-[acyl-carrier-protein] synthase II [Kerstersia gyiorum]MCP1710654.1 3-oxoacyl-[acyl-carrier-protein] synthase II [Kerstersia gyiorum]
MKRRVVITAIGMASPVGDSAQACFDALNDARCGVALHPDGQLAREVGFVRGDVAAGLPGNQAIMLDRVSLLAMYAARQALEQGGLEADEQVGCGVFVGTGIGGVSALCDAVGGFHGVVKKRVQLVIPAAMPNAPAAHIAQRMASTQEAQTYATACTAGAVAIGEAFRRIRDGYLDVALAGGSEAMLRPELLQAWSQLQVLCVDAGKSEQGGCRPFSKGRTGFALGEGAAMLLIESYEHALARGARPIVEICGYGVSNDGTHALRPNHEGQALAIQRAMDEARLSPADIRYINAHATGTLTGDKVETRAICKVFGAQADELAVSSIKGAIGHLIGAGGAVETAITAMSLQQQVLPPTLKYESGDDECDLDYVPGAARQVHGLGAALSNSFGMGGNNAVLALAAL